MLPSLECNKRQSCLEAWEKQGTFSSLSLYIAKIGRTQRYGSELERARENGTRSNNCPGHGHLLALGIKTLARRKRKMKLSGHQGAKSHQKRRETRIRTRKSRKHTQKTTANELALRSAPSNKRKTLTAARAGRELIQRNKAVLVQTDKVLSVIRTRAHKEKV